MWFPAQRPGADAQIQAALSGAVDGRYPHDWSDEQRGEAVARDYIEPLSILLLASAVGDEGEAGGAVQGKTDIVV